MRLQRVVIGMDFSDSALAAARWIAWRFAPEAELVLVHAIDVPQPPRFLRGRYPPVETVLETAREGAERRLRELAAILGPRLVWTEIREQRASDAIIDVATEYRASLIVVGKHGERADGHARVGSTAERVLRGGAVPVLLVPGEPERAPRHILVPIDDSDVTPTVLMWARQLASRFDATATALHVVSSAIFSSVLSMAAVGSGGAVHEPERMREEVRHEADRWMAKLISAGVRRERVESDVAFGDAAHEIVSAAQRTEADLIVMGAHGAGRVARALMGSTTAEVLRMAPCPTLVVRETDAERQR